MSNSVQGQLRPGVRHGAHVSLKLWMRANDLRQRPDQERQSSLQFAQDEWHDRFTQQDR
jgi:hypothetical protein